MIVVVVPGAKEEGEPVTEGVAVIPAGAVVVSLPVGLEPPVVLSPVGLEPPVVLSPVGLELPVVSSLEDGTPVGMAPSLVEEVPDSVAEETGVALEEWSEARGVELGAVWVWVWACV